MSDIYLQITETPTVVTLSAPVVSGALASTVTVANTVTVALDSNSLSALENVTVTVGAAITGTVTVSNFPSTQTIAGTVTANVPVLDQSIRDGILLFNQTEGNIGVSVNYSEPISGTVTANIPLVNIQPTVTSGLGVILLTDEGKSVFDNSSSIKATLTTALPAGTNRIGVVTIGGGTVTIGAGTAQIGSVTASISNSLTIASLPALVAGTAQIGSVTASISNSVVTFYPMQGTTVSNTNFTSVTASTTLVSAVANREVLTVFNEGPANLFISPGATCTSVSYQVRLSSGDYWECPQGQLSLLHTAVFTTAATARVTQVS